MMPTSMTSRRAQLVGSRRKNQQVPVDPLRLARNRTDLVEPGQAPADRVVGQLAILGQRLRANPADAVTVDIKRQHAQDGLCVNVAELEVPGPGMRLVGGNTARTAFRCCQSHKSIKGTR
jgi:hypothetical protein